MEDQGIRDLEFFAEPGEALGLAGLEVVDCEWHFSSRGC